MAEAFKVPQIQALSVSALFILITLGPIILILALTVEKAFPAQVFLIQVLLTQVPPVQAFLTSALLITNELNYKQNGKHLEQVQISSPSDIYFLIDKCTDNYSIFQLS